MSRIAVMTPDPHDPSYAGQWPGVLERLGQALATAGVTVEPTPWTDHIQDASALVDYPLVLPLITWGYHRDHARWIAATRTWGDARVRMLNPPAVLGWNSDKSYLQRLAGRDVPIPQTLWTEEVAPADIETAFRAFDTDTLVIKPRVSGGAWKTVRLSRGEALGETPDGAAMIQPYLSSIESEGETSLLFFGGRFSHAVRKSPVAGEFRIQVQFGGRYETVTPTSEAMALAEQTLAAIDDDLLYARIDMARGPQGDWLLMEAELIEPDFYLSNAPDGGRAFAEAVSDRLSASG